MKQEQEYIISEILKVSEEFFETCENFDQIPATREALEKNLYLHQKSFLYRTTEDNELIGWIVIIPTSKVLAE